MAGKKQKQEGVGAWIAIVILFAVGLWPIALVMLLVKLFGNDGRSGGRPRPRCRRRRRSRRPPHPPGLPAGPKRPCAAP